MSKENATIKKMKKLLDYLEEDVNPDDTFDCLSQIQEQLNKLVELNNKRMSNDIL